MKKSNIIKGFASALVAVTLASCSSDYLDLKPIGNEDAANIPSDVTTMRSATYGLMQNMYSQYSTLYDYLWFNGEPWFSMVYGEACGGDFNSYFIAAQTGYSMSNWSHMKNENSWGDDIIWKYLYGIVDQANTIISGEAIAEAKGELKGELAFRVAQAYTMRAHAYTRLQQCYANRWVDSKNGTRHSVVIRTEAPDPSKPTAKPVSSFREVQDLIYSDLNRALELFDLSEFDRTYMWETNKSVAYGLYARAALLEDNWTVAEDMAHKASQGFEIMSAADYKAGFASPTSEWMWCSQMGPTGLYYASFGASYACNGAYPCIWGNYGAGAVDYELYKKVQNTRDVRCSLFYTPDKVGRALRARFWNEDDCSGQTLNINVGDNFPAALQTFCDQKYEEIGKPNRWKFPYSGDYNKDAVLIYETYIPFGAQFKFWGTDSYASSQFPFMRASEMLLIEAEAACHNNHPAVAQDCLYRINSNRIEGYVKSTKTGDDLLAEVKLNRRWELWGEGFNWFDFKRWNEPIVRKAWEAGNMQSGNWPDSYADTFPVDEAQGWKWLIPRCEIDYNDDVTSAINRDNYD